MSHRRRVAQFVIDVDDLDQGVVFWSAALEASSGVYRKLRLPESNVRILLQRTADPKTHKERMHLDLESDGVEAEVRRLESIGATRYDHQQESKEVLKRTTCMPSVLDGSDLCQRIWRHGVALPRQNLVAFQRDNYGRNSIRISFPGCGSSRLIENNVGPN